METISSIDGITVKYYVEKGMGKFVFDSIISASNRILTDNDIEEFRKKAVEYGKRKGNGDKRRFKKYSEKYMDMYKTLKEICERRKKYDQIRGAYVSSEGMHCDYNNHYMIDRIYGIRYGF